MVILHGYGEIHVDVGHQQALQFALGQVGDRYDLGDDLGGAQAEYHLARVLEHRGLEGALQHAGDEFGVLDRAVFHCAHRGIEWETGLDLAVFAYQRDLDLFPAQLYGQHIAGYFTFAHKFCSSSGLPCF